MRNEEAMPGTIVVGVDGSAHAKQALTWAAEQAVVEGRPLTVVHVADEGDLPPAVRPGYAGAIPRSMPDRLGLSRKVVRDAVAVVEQLHPGLATFGLPLAGDPRSQLVRLSETAHLLVLGSRGRGAFASMVLGSVSVNVAKHATCPVVVTRSGADNAVGDGVLVGADGTPESLQIIEFAFRQASLRRLPLTVLHTSFEIAAAVDATPHDEKVPGTADDLRLVLSESVAGMAEKFPEVRVTTELGVGLADECLTRGSRRWDLIVVGRRPSHLLSSLFASSVSTSVLERAECPVAVVPEADDSD
jgi:nucleotide-binding universal stress UspA family protein